MFLLHKTCTFPYYGGLSKYSGFNPRPLSSLISIFFHQPKRRFCLSECCSLDLQIWLLAPTQLFLQPQLIPHSEQSVSIINTVSSSRRRTSHITQNLVAVSAQPGRHSLIHKRVLCKACKSNERDYCLITTSKILYNIDVVLLFLTRKY